MPSAIATAYPTLLPPVVVPLAPFVSVMSVESTTKYSVVSATFVIVTTTDAIVWSACASPSPTVTEENRSVLPSFSV